MMLHTKYLGFRPYGFRQEDFFMFYLNKPMSTCDPRGQAIFDHRGIEFQKTRIKNVTPRRGHFWPQGHNFFFKKW